MWQTFIIMDKKEYLRNRFLKDFLQYNLLQNDSISDKEIADILYKEVDLEPFIVKSKQEIGHIIEKYLSFEKVKLDGKLSNTLSSELDYGIKGKIITEYKIILDNIKNEILAKDIIGKIGRSIELQTWSNGIMNMKKAISLLVERLNNVSECYEGLYATSISENELQDKFRKAEENTLFERIQGNNIDDIIDYRNSMIEFVQAVCENMLYEKLVDIYKIIADDKFLKQLQDKFDYLSKYAVELKSSIKNFDEVLEWDKEYNHMVPTDFYFRNVENITAEQAFHMVLLQFFARNEDWLKENGMLYNGEICVYTSRCKDTLNNLLIKVGSCLM